MVKLRKVRYFQDKDKNMEHLVSLTLQVLSANPEYLLYSVIGIFSFKLITSLFSTKSYQAKSSYKIVKWG
jgi:uncharacterized membrane protein YuzA (DUF378 family)